MKYCPKVKKNCLFSRDKFCCGDTVEPPRCYDASAEMYLEALKVEREKKVTP